MTLGMSEPLLSKMAIRKCCCLIFAVFPSSLSSKWVSREVKYANDICGKPIVPFVVSAIPDEIQEESSLFIQLMIEKQILNSTCTWDMGVLIRESCVESLLVVGSGELE